MKQQSVCPCKVVVPDTDRYKSVTKTDYLAPPWTTPSHHYRTLTFCTPDIEVMRPGGCISAPLGLSCATSLLYTAGEGAPDNTAGPLASSLPTAWTGGAGVEHGEDTTYKHLTPTHLDMCREGGLCAGSKLLATRELEDIRDRYRETDRLTKQSTPSGHRGRQLHLERMYSNMAELDLIIADTKQGRKDWTGSSEPYQPRQSRDLYRVYDW